MGSHSELLHKSILEAVASGLHLGSDGTNRGLSSFTDLSSLLQNIHNIEQNCRTTLQQEQPPSTSSFASSSSSNIPSYSPPWTTEHMDEVLKHNRLYTNHTLVSEYIVRDYNHSLRPSPVHSRTIIDTSLPSSLSSSKDNHHNVSSITTIPPPPKPFSTEDISSMVSIIAESFRIVLPTSSSPSTATSMSSPSTSTTSIQPSSSVTGTASSGTADEEQKTEQTGTSFSSNVAPVTSSLHQQNEQYGQMGILSYAPYLCTVPERVPVPLNALRLTATSSSASEPLLPNVSDNPLVSVGIIVHDIPLEEPTADSNENGYPARNVLHHGGEGDNNDSPFLHPNPASDRTLRYSESLDGTFSARIKRSYQKILLGNGSTPYFSFIHIQWENDLVPEQVCLQLSKDEKEWITADTVSLKSLPLSEIRSLPPLSSSSSSSASSGNSIVSRFTTGTLMHAYKFRNDHLSSSRFTTTTEENTSLPYCYPVCPDAVSFRLNFRGHHPDASRKVIGIRSIRMYSVPDKVYQDYWGFSRVQYPAKNPTDSAVYNPYGLSLSTAFPSTLQISFSDAIHIQINEYYQNIQNELHSLTGLTPLLVDDLYSLARIVLVTGSTVALFRIVRILHDLYTFMNTKSSLSSVEESVFLRVQECVRNLSLGIRYKSQQQFFQQTLKEWKNDMDVLGNRGVNLFDANAHSYNVVLTSGKTSVESINDEVDISANGYALGQTGFPIRGLHSWSFRIDKDRQGDESIAVGFAVRPIRDTQFRTSSDMWTVRCYNGTVVTARSGNRLITHIPHGTIPEGSTVTFYLDGNNRQVSVAVNGTIQGTVFQLPSDEELSASARAARDTSSSSVSTGTLPLPPPLLYPCVAFYNGGRKVTLLKVKTDTNDNTAVDDITTSSKVPLCRLPLLSFDHTVSLNNSNVPFTTDQIGGVRSGTDESIVWDTQNGIDHQGSKKTVTAASPIKSTVTMTKNEHNISFLPDIRVISSLIQRSIASTLSTGGISTTYTDHEDEFRVTKAAESTAANTNAATLSNISESSLLPKPLNISSAHHAASAVVTMARYNIGGVFGTLSFGLDLLRSLESSATPYSNIASDVHGWNGTTYHLFVYGDTKQRSETDRRLLFTTHPSKDQCLYSDGRTVSVTDDSVSLLSATDSSRPSRYTLNVTDVHFLTFLIVATVDVTVPSSVTVGEELPPPTITPTDTSVEVTSSTVVSSSSTAALGSFANVPRTTAGILESLYSSLSLPSASLPVLVLTDPVLEESVYRRSCTVDDVLTGKLLRDIISFGNLSAPETLLAGDSFQRVREDLLISVLESKVEMNRTLWSMEDTKFDEEMKSMLSKKEQEDTKKAITAAENATINEFYAEKLFPYPGLLHLVSQSIGFETLGDTEGSTDKSAVLSPPNGKQGSSLDQRRRTKHKDNTGEASTLQTTLPVSDPAVRFFVRTVLAPRTVNEPETVPPSLSSNTGTIVPPSTTENRIPPVTQPSISAPSGSTRQSRFEDELQRAIQLSIAEANAVQPVPTVAIPPSSTTSNTVTTTGTMAAPLTNEQLALMFGIDGPIDDELALALMMSLEGNNPVETVSSGVVPPVPNESVSTTSNVAVVTEPSATSVSIENEHSSTNLPPSITIHDWDIAFVPSSTGSLPVSTTVQRPSLPSSSTSSSSTSSSIDASLPHITNLPSIPSSSGSEETKTTETAPLVLLPNAPVEVSLEIMVLGRYYTVRIPLPTAVKVIVVPTPLNPSPSTRQVPDDHSWMGQRLSPVISSSVLNTTIESLQLDLFDDNYRALFHDLDYLQKVPVLEPPFSAETFRIEPSYAMLNELTILFCRSYNDSSPDVTLLKILILYLDDILERFGNASYAVQPCISNIHTIFRLLFAVSNDNRLDTDVRSLAVFLLHSRIMILQPCVDDTVVVLRNLLTSVPSIDHPQFDPLQLSLVNSLLQYVYRSIEKGYFHHRGIGMDSPLYELQQLLLDTMLRTVDGTFWVEKDKLKYSFMKTVKEIQKFILVFCLNALSTGSIAIRETVHLMKADNPEIDTLHRIKAYRNDALRLLVGYTSSLFDRFTEDSLKTSFRLSDNMDPDSVGGCIIRLLLYPLLNILQTVSGYLPVVHALSSKLVAYTRRFCSVFITDTPTDKFEVFNFKMENALRTLFTDDRDNYTGQVGIRFTVLKRRLCRALGRAVNPKFHNGHLQRNHILCLWNDNDQRLIAYTIINDQSERDSLGYAVGRLTNPVILHETETYRLTSTEYAGSGDPWYDPSQNPSSLLQDGNLSPKFKGMDSAFELLSDVYLDDRSWIANTSNNSASTAGNLPSLASRQGNVNAVDQGPLGSGSNSSGSYMIDGQSLNFPDCSRGSRRGFGMVTLFFDECKYKKGNEERDDISDDLLFTFPNTFLLLTLRTLLIDTTARYLSVYMASLPESEEEEAVAPWLTLSPLSNVNGLLHDKSKQLLLALVLTNTGKEAVKVSELHKQLYLPPINDADNRNDEMIIPSTSTGIVDTVQRIEKHFRSLTPTNPAEESKLSDRTELSHHGSSVMNPTNDTSLLNGFLFAIAEGFDENATDNNSSRSFSSAWLEELRGHDSATYNAYLHWQSIEVPAKLLTLADGSYPIKPQTARVSSSLPDNHQQQVEEQRVPESSREVYRGVTMILEAWLQTQAPEQKLVRRKARHLSASGPYLAALLYHTGLVSEAVQVVNSIVTGSNPLEVSGTRMLTDLPTISPIMGRLWSRLKAFRDWIRKELLHYRTVMEKLQSVAKEKLDETSTVTESVSNASTTTGTVVVLNPPIVAPSSAEEDTHPSEENDDSSDEDENDELAGTNAEIEAFIPENDDDDGDDDEGEGDEGEEDNDNTDGVDGLLENLMSQLMRTSETELPVRPARSLANVDQPEGRDTDTRSSSVSSTQSSLESSVARYSLLIRRHKRVHRTLRNRMLCPTSPETFLNDLRSRSLYALLTRSTMENYGPQNGSVAPDSSVIVPTTTGINHQTVALLSSVIRTLPPPSSIVAATMGKSLTDNGNDDTDFENSNDSNALSSSSAVSLVKIKDTLLQAGLRTVQPSEAALQAVTVYVKYGTHIPPLMLLTSILRSKVRINLKIAGYTLFAQFLNDLTVVGQTLVTEKDSYGSVQFQAGFLARALKYFRSSLRGYGRTDVERSMALQLAISDSTKNKFIARSKRYNRNLPLSVVQAPMDYVPWNRLVQKWTQSILRNDISIPLWVPGCSPMVTVPDTGNYRDGNFKIQRYPEHYFVFNGDYSNLYVAEEAGRIHHPLSNYHIQHIVGKEQYEQCHRSYEKIMEWLYDTLESTLVPVFETCSEKLGSPAVISSTNSKPRTEIETLSSSSWLLTLVRLLRSIYVDTEMDVSSFMNRPSVVSSLQRLAECLYRALDIVHDPFMGLSTRSPTILIGPTVTVNQIYDFYNELSPATVSQTMENGTVTKTEMVLLLRSLLYQLSNHFATVPSLTNTEPSLALQNWFIRFTEFYGVHGATIPDIVKNHSIVSLSRTYKHIHSLILTSVTEWKPVHETFAEDFVPKNIYQSFTALRTVQNISNLFLRYTTVTNASVAILRQTQYGMMLLPSAMGTRIGGDEAPLNSSSSDLTKLGGDDDVRPEEYGAIEAMNALNRAVCTAIITPVLLSRPLHAYYEGLSSWTVQSFSNLCAKLVPSLSLCLGKGGNATSSINLAEYAYMEKQVYDTLLWFNQAAAVPDSVQPNHEPQSNVISQIFTNDIFWITVLHSCLSRISARIAVQTCRLCALLLPRFGPDHPIWMRVVPMAKLNNPTEDATETIPSSVTFVKHLLFLASMWMHGLIRSSVSNPVGTVHKVVRNSTVDRDGASQWPFFGAEITENYVQGQVHRSCANEIISLLRILLSCAVIGWRETSVPVWCRYASVAVADTIVRAASSVMDSTAVSSTVLVSSAPSTSLSPSTVLSKSLSLRTGVVESSESSQSGVAITHGKIGTTMVATKPVPEITCQRMRMGVAALAVLSVSSGTESLRTGSRVLVRSTPLCTSDADSDIYASVGTATLQSQGIGIIVGYTYGGRTAQIIYEKGTEGMYSYAFLLPLLDNASARYEQELKDQNSGTIPSLSNVIITEFNEEISRSLFEGNLAMLRAIASRIDATTGGSVTGTGTVNSQINTILSSPSVINGDGNTVGSINVKVNGRVGSLYNARADTEDVDVSLLLPIDTVPPPADIIVLASPGRNSSLMYPSKNTSTLTVPNIMPALSAFVSMTMDSHLLHATAMDLSPAGVRTRSSSIAESYQGEEFSQRVPDLAIDIGLRSALQIGAFQVLDTLIAHPTNCAAVVSSGLLNRIMDTALVSLPLPSFVCLPRLRYRFTTIANRLTERAGWTMDDEIVTGTTASVLRSPPSSKRYDDQHTLGFAVGSKSIVQLNATVSDTNRWLPSISLSKDTELHPYADIFFTNPMTPQSMVPTTKTGTNTSTVSSMAQPPEEIVDIAELERRQNASVLVSMGFGFDMEACMSALRRCANNLERAVNWIMTPDARRILSSEADERRQAEQAAVMGGEALTGSGAGGIGSVSAIGASVPSNRSNANESGSTAVTKITKDTVRWRAADQLSGIYSMPVNLCFQALLINNEDPNMAMSWLMDQGANYVAAMFDENFTAQTAAADAQADEQTRKQEALDDQAALEGIDDTVVLLPGIRSSNSTGSLHNNDGGIDPNMPQRMFGFRQGIGPGFLRNEFENPLSNRENDAQRLVLGNTTVPIQPDLSGSNHFPSADLTYHRAAVGVPELKVESVHEYRDTLTAGTCVFISRHSGPVDNIVTAPLSLLDQRNHGFILSSGIIQVQRDGNESRNLRQSSYTSSNIASHSSVNSNFQTLFLIGTVHPETGIVTVRRVAEEAVCFPAPSLFGRKVQRTGQLRSLFVSHALYLSTHIARRVMASVVHFWSTAMTIPLTLSALGGGDRVILLTKLLAAPTDTFTVVEENTAGTTTSKNSNTTGVPATANENNPENTNADAVEMNGDEDSYAVVSTLQFGMHRRRRNNPSDGHPSSPTLVNEDRNRIAETFSVSLLVGTGGRGLPSNNIIDISLPIAAATDSISTMTITGSSGIGNLVRTGTPDNTLRRTGTPQHSGQRGPVHRSTPSLRARADSDNMALPPPMNLDAQISASSSSNEESIRPIPSSATETTGSTVSLSKSSTAPESGPRPAVDVIRSALLQMLIQEVKAKAAAIQSATASVTVSRTTTGSVLPVGTHPSTIMAHNLVQDAASQFGLRTPTQPVTNAFPISPFIQPINTPMIASLALASNPSTSTVTDTLPSITMPPPLPPLDLTASILSGTERKTENTLDLPPSATKLQRVQSNVSTSSTSSGSSRGIRLARLLLEQCVSNFVVTTALDDEIESLITPSLFNNGENTTDTSNRRQIIDSLHPYYHRCEYVGEVECEGAKAIRITFDPRCEFAREGTTLTFYSDRGCTNIVCKYPVRETSGSQSNAATSARVKGETFFPPLIVHADRVYYRFRSDKREEISHGWGFRFIVRPMRGLQWLNEHQVIADSSLEWACWLLQFLLDDVGRCSRELFEAAHSRAIFDALVRYLRTPGAPYKSRVSNLLSKLLAHPSAFPATSATQLPNMQTLLPIADLIMQKAQRERDSGRMFLAPQLLRLVELSTSIYIANRAFMERTKHFPVDTTVTNPSLGMTKLDKQLLVSPNTYYSGGAGFAPQPVILCGTAPNERSPFKFGKPLPVAPVKLHVRPRIQRILPPEDSSVTLSRLFVDIADLATTLSSAPSLMDILSAAENNATAGWANDIVQQVLLVPSPSHCLLADTQDLAMLRNYTKDTSPSSSSSSASPIIPVKHLNPSSIRLRDDLLCRIYMNSIQNIEVRESLHPYRQGECRGGWIVMEGANSIRLTLDRRTAVAVGCSLRFWNSSGELISLGGTMDVPFVRDTTSSASASISSSSSTSSGSNIGNSSSAASKKESAQAGNMKRWVGKGMDVVEVQGDRVRWEYISILDNGSRPTVGKGVPSSIYPSGKIPPDHAEGFQNPANSLGLWGFAFTVSTSTWKNPPGTETFITNQTKTLENLTNNDERSGSYTLDEALVALSQWPRELDELLVQWINNHSVHAVGTEDENDHTVNFNTVQGQRRMLRSALEASPTDVRLSRKESTFQYELLSRVPIRALHLRFGLIQLFNRRLSRILELIDVTSGSLSTTSSLSALSSNTLMSLASLFFGTSTSSAASPVDTSVVSSESTLSTTFQPNLLAVGTAPLSYQLRGLGYLIFSELKQKLLEASVTATWASNSRHSSRPVIQIDNMRAMMSAEGGAAADAVTSQCSFVQAYRQLSKLSPSAQSQLYRSKIDDRGRLWSVKYVDEAGIDYGGVFRDAITGMVEDVFSERLDLCLPCPNARLYGVGPGGGGNTNAMAIEGGIANDDTENGDKYLPNPKYTTGHHPRVLPMYEFLGKLMGVSLRGKLSLPFEFPSLIWKILIGQPVSLTDLRAVDIVTADHLLTISSWVYTEGNMYVTTTGVSSSVGVPSSTASPGLTGISSIVSTNSPLLRSSNTPPLSGIHGSSGTYHITNESTVTYSKAAAEAFLIAFPSVYFTVRTLDGRTVELIRGGSTVQVTLMNRAHYVALAAAYHLTAYDSLIHHIRRGLYSIVPARALRLLTWEEVSIAVGGRPEIDVQLLREHTDYEGYRSDDRVIGYFWKVMEEFTNEERSLFIRFAWGRSRLPVGRRWPKRFKISRRPPGDEQLPMAHTCFFSIDLPNYSNLERTRSALLTAIHFSSGILNA